ncbi:MAG: N-acetylmuramoyl-L-alanine amidase [Campylobacterota bacterium]|nr:N-acetylmuramoyl-L-alanine amidase [Campylobacterota bacterium]
MKINIFRDIFKIFLFISLSYQSSFAISSSYYQDKFKATKKLYLGAVISNNKSNEIKYLKKLITYGDKIEINTLKYKKELNRLDKTTSVHKPIKTKFTLKPKYTIKSIKQTKNSIIIDFYNNINSSFLKFSEKRDKYYYFDYFDIKGSYKYAKPTKLSFKVLNRTIVKQTSKNRLRISLKSKRNPKTIYIINKKQIIIKLLDKVIVKKKVSSIKQKVKLLPSDLFVASKKTIVIDAGHGGKDSGAVGNNRKYEKSIVLNITKYLKQELQRKGFRVYLTRSRDRFVKLSKRTHLANKKKADMFISIHANAARKSRAKEAHGIETYFLSPARSARAKRVAAKENKGDMRSMGWSSKNSLLTILNRGKITASNKMAIDIQKNMLFSLRGKYGKNNIKDGGVREGPFWVLVGAQMPSILIEVGYISHPKESRRINTKKYQKLIAKGIAKGCESYFLKNQ